MSDRQRQKHGIRKEHTIKPLVDIVVVRVADHEVGNDIFRRAVGRVRRGCRIRKIRCSGVDWMRMRKSQEEEGEECTDC